MNKILVIGASGYLGSRLMQEDIGKQMIGTFFQHHQPGLEFLNLCDRNSIVSLITRTQPDVVLFAAGINDVDRCQIEPSLAFKINAEALSVFTQFPTIKVVYYSTAYVFDGTLGYYDENTKPNPLNVYGESKLCGEKIVLENNSSNLVIRISELYGASALGINYLNKSNFSEKYIYAEDDCFFNPVAIDDVLLATRLLLRCNATSIFHVAGSSFISRYEYQQLLNYYTSDERIVIPVSVSSIRRIAPIPRNTSLSTERISQLGWQTKPLPEGLQTYLGKKPFCGVHTTCANPLADIVDNSRVQAILIGCVGGLLTTRDWIKSASEHSYALGQQFKRVTENLGYAENKQLQLNQLLMTTQYALNPPVWSCLAYWRHHYKLVLVSDETSSLFHMWVRYYGLDNIFDMLANPKDLSLQKPDFNFFIQIANFLGLQPNQCLIINDNDEVILEAEKCGMEGIKTFPLRKFPLSEHNVVVCNDENKALKKVHSALLQLGYPAPISHSTSLRSIGIDSLDIVMLMCQLKIPSSLKIKQSITLDTIDIVQDLIQKYLI